MKANFFYLFLTVGLFFSCSKEETNNTNTDTNTGGALFQQGAGVTDAEGNSYKTIIISVSGVSTLKSATQQEWMAENLKATKYADGTAIDAFQMTPCNKDSSTIAKLGYLYSWNALMKNSTTERSQGACPNGWHVPSIGEYNALITKLGGASVAGKKMKSTDTTFWNDVTMNDNTGGFNALAGGWSSTGMHFFYKQSTMFWTSSEDGGSAKVIQLNSRSEGAINAYGSSKETKISCRCVKD